MSGTAGPSRRAFDVVFADTCLGGSTVAARAGASLAGLRAYYLADYAVNPLGVKTRLEVRGALERWIVEAAALSGTLVVACNTASVLLEQLPDLARVASATGLRLVSMVQLMDRALASSPVRGRRVCLMGTRFTVGEPIYRERLASAGAAAVVPLAATRTEQVIARLRHATDDGRREIEQEIAESIRDSEVVVLACTLFPMVAPLLRAINPDCVLVDPATGIDGLLPGASTSGANRLTIGVTGDAFPVDAVREQAGALFPRWSIERVSAAVLQGA